MKKTLLLLAVSFSVIATKAQKEKTISAYNGWKSAYKALSKDKIDDAVYAVAEAKTLIDEASIHEQTKTDPKTLYYKIKIYNLLAAVYQSAPENAEIQKIINKDNVEEFTKASEDAFTSLKEYDTRKEFIDKLKDEFQSQYEAVFNKAIEFYQSTDYTKAYVLFSALLKGSQKYEIVDTTSAFNGALAANEIEQWEGVEKLSRYCVENGHSQKEAAYQLLYLALENQKKVDEAIKTIEEARNKFPQNEIFLQYHVNILIGNDKYEEAVGLIEEAVAKFPNNVALIFNAGVTYNEMKNIDKAVEMFSKCAELEPNNIMYVKTIGDVYRNEGVNIRNEANLLPEEKQAEFDALKTKEKEFFAKAGEYYEKALVIEPENQSIIKNLVIIYQAAGQYEKAVEMKKKIKQ